jgi:ABC-type multidrug transport system permease subunit
MRQTAIINPEAYAVHVLRLLMYKNAMLPVALGDFAFLSVFTTIMLALATLAFKRGL